MRKKTVIFHSMIFLFKVPKIKMGLKKIIQVALLSL